MKIIIAALMLFALTGTAMAQITHTSNGDVDQNADAVLKKAAQKMNDGTVSFAVTMVMKDQNKKEASRVKADVLYSKGKYRATFDNNVIYSDGTAVWHWNKDVDEVVVNNMEDGDDNLMNPGAVLANYSKNFKAKYIRQEADGTAVVDLTPKKSKSYYKIRVLADAKTGVLKQLVMNNYDSSCTEFIVSNFKSGVKTSSSDFVFPKASHPNVEVIDMR